MKKPPEKIDGANVLEWSWSGEQPFGVVKSAGNNEVTAEIFGLAICQYDNSNVIYRFSCDKNWETEQDFDYSSVTEAKEYLPFQYKAVSINWIIYE
jgi:hypothetical protein